MEDLTDRFVRIVKVPEEDTQEEEDGQGADGETSQTTQRNQGKVLRYLKHVPHLSLIRLQPECPQAEDVHGLEAGQRAEGSVTLQAAGPYARLRYCPRYEARTSGRIDGQEGSEEEENGAESPEGGNEERVADGDDSEVRPYLARIELESVIEPMIIPGAFDSILLADHKGRTLFQQGEPELRMLDLAPLVESAAEAEDRQGVLARVRDLLGRQDPGVGTAAIERFIEEQEERPIELGARTAMVKVEIAGSDYYVFLQPVSPQLEPPPGHGAGEPVRWIAAGIISSENLLSAGLTTSPFLLFILVSILPLGIVAWPFLKLSLITRRQPFHRLDLAALLFASVLGIALAALLIFDLLFLVHLHGDVDDQLEDLGFVVSDRFHKEILTARKQLVALNDDAGKLLPQPVASDDGGNAEIPGGCTGRGVIAEGPGPTQQSPIEDLGDLYPVTYIEDTKDAPGRLATRQFIETPVRDLLDQKGLDFTNYSYFDSVFWATPGGDHGCANLPLREHAVLPQNIEDRAYFRCARDCEPKPVFLSDAEAAKDTELLDLWRQPKKEKTVADNDVEPTHANPDGATSSAHAGCHATFLDTAPPDSVPLCFQSFLDRTTGTSVAAIALPGPNENFPVAALVTRLTSIAHPVLPPGYGFAIVEPGGRVLFHSEPRRDLTESFLEASDEDPVLRSLLEQRRSGHLSLHYWGQPTRVHVRTLAGLPWSLVTFRNTYDLRVRNFELIYDFLNPFLLYLGIVTLLALTAWVFLPRRLRRYLWPSSEHRELYRAVALSTTGIVALFALVLLWAPPGGILWASLLALPAMLGVTEVLRRNRPWERSEVQAKISKLRARWNVPARFRTAWREKRWWLFLGSFLALAVLGAVCVLASEAPVMPVLLAVLAACLAWALLWHWHGFSGERRKIAFVFAFGCVLLVSALLPALGFLHLARSRQIQLYTQDAQVALARELEEREGAIAERLGPLTHLYPGSEADADGKQDQGPQQNGNTEESQNASQDEGNRDMLVVTRDDYLGAFFGTEDKSEDARDSDSPSPVWRYGLYEPDTDTGQDQDGTGPEDGADPEDVPGPGFVDGLLAARPFPLNDLSARPVESDLSRFGAGEVRWNRGSDHRLVLSWPRHHGTLESAESDSIRLSSTVPGVTDLPGVAGPKTAAILLGLLFLGLSPFLLSHFLADRVLLIGLVGRPRDEEETESGDRATPVASTPLESILEEVRENDEVVQQVVLVSTLPGPSAWAGQVEGEDLPGVDPPKPSNGDPPRFHRVSFADAWHRARSEAESAASSGTEDDPPPEADDRDARGETEIRSRPANDAQRESPGALAERFYRSLSPGAGRSAASNDGQEQDDEDDPQPVLLTSFEPALDDANAAAAQVAALRRLALEDGRSVVILAETVPDPELGRGAQEEGRDPKAQRLWTELLATYGVEYGYDARSHDLVGKKARPIRKQIDHIVEQLKPAGELREELRAIQRNLERIERECCPTPVLRNIGWSLLEELEDVLPRLRLEIEATSPGASSGEQREMQDRVEKALRRVAAISKRTDGREEDEDQEEHDEEEERAAALRELGEVLRESHRRGQNPVVLLRRGAAAIGDGPSEEAKLLKRAAELLRSAADGELQPKPAEEDGAAKTDRDRGIAAIETARQDLSRELVTTAFQRRRVQRARKLHQLFTWEHILAKVGAKARLHYRYLWSQCTTDEKLVLVQLAENGLVNPKYFGWVMDLMNRGLVVRDPGLRLMNESFRRFVLQEVRRSQVLAWQEEEGPSGWSVLKWILPAPLILVAAFLFVTQRDALSNVTGVLVAAISLAPLLVNLYSQFREVSARREAKEEKKDNKDEGSDKGSK